MNNLESGKLININKNLYTIMINNNSVFECTVRGKLKNDELIVGDNVLFDKDKLTIEKIQARKNSLIRPFVSNIDKLLIITSTHIPKFSTYLIDKFIVIALQNNIEPIIIITKEDLISFKEKIIIKKYIKYYKKLGYKVYLNTETNKIKKEFKNSVVALCGQTGAGKSTLLNKIDNSLNLQTDDVSKALGRGKHTTRMVTLHIINDGLVADTPGFSSVDLNITKEELKNYFIEFGFNCKYKSCNHINEEGCKVKNNRKILSSRYENYLKLYEELNKNIVKY